MSFKDGEDAERDCPKCGKPMEYEMSFTDQFSYKTGHYTSDRPIVVCTECEYFEEYEVFENEDI